MDDSTCSASAWTALVLDLGNHFRLRQNLNPAVARVLKRLHYSADVILLVRSMAKTRS